MTGAEAMRRAEDVWLDGGDTDDLYDAFRAGGCSHAEAHRWLRTAQERGVTP